MKQLLLVFIGGGFGSVLRYVLSLKFNNFESAMPYGTMVANVLGSLLIGLVLGYIEKSGALTQNHSLLLATGFCGGLTTFSTFAYENHLLLKNSDYFSMIPYMAITFILGISAVFLGMFLAKTIALF